MVLQFFAVIKADVNFQKKDVLFSEHITGFVMTHWQCKRIFALWINVLLRYSNLPVTFTTPLIHLMLLLLCTCCLILSQTKMVLSTCMQVFKKFLRSLYIYVTEHEKTKLKTQFAILHDVHIKMKSLFYCL